MQKLMEHWQKLGQFRNRHMAVGAGVHKMIAESPYTFSRRYTKGDHEDKVVVALDVSQDKKNISVSNVFEDGTKLKDAYSGKEMIVEKGSVIFSSVFDVVLLELNN